MIDAPLRQLGAASPPPLQQLYSLERSGNPFIFIVPSLASFMVCCGSQNHDLFVAEGDDWVDAHGSAGRDVAGG